MRFDAPAPRKFACARSIFPFVVQDRAQGQTVAHSATLSAAHDEDVSALRDRVRDGRATANSTVAGAQARAADQAAVGRSPRRPNARDSSRCAGQLTM